MTTFESIHSFSYKDKNIEIVNYLDMRDRDIRGHYGALAPIRIPKIYINGNPAETLSSLSSFGMALRKSLESDDFTVVEDFIKEHIDQYY